MVEESVKGFIESSFLDWPGKVAAVLFLPGCNFRCPFCHNPSLVLRPDSVQDIPLAKVLSSLRAHQGWVDGVVVTGGEPTVFSGLEPLLTRLKGDGLLVKLDTNGSRPEILKALMARGLVDAVAMDIKAPLEAGIYSRAAGVPVDIAAIAESIKVLIESGLELTFRATVVPGIHDEAAVRAMAETLHGRGLALQNFRPDGVLDPAFSLLKPFGPAEFADMQAACHPKGAV